MFVGRFVNHDFITPSASTVFGEGGVEFESFFASDAAVVVVSGHVMTFACSEGNQITDHHNSTPLVGDVFEFTETFTAIFTDGQSIFLCMPENMSINLLPFFFVY